MTRENRTLQSVKQSNFTSQNLEDLCRKVLATCVTKLSGITCGAIVREGCDLGSTDLNLESHHKFGLQNSVEDVDHLTTMTKAKLESA